MAESLDKGREVHARVPYVSDKEIHVSTLESPHREGVGEAPGWFVDIREFIPSLGEYGRGITFPGPLFPDIMAGLDRAYRDLGYDRALDVDQNAEGEDG